MFVATANFVQNIPAPLLDRMEVVDYPGYTEREKVSIARDYLVPRALADTGLTAEQIALPEDAVREVIVAYTREAGVRQLERELTRLARKVARRIAGGETAKVTVGAADVRALLGRPRKESWRSPRARTRSAPRPACTTRPPAATSCSSRRRRCAARAT